jgi:hypothetical protein
MLVLSTLLLLAVSYVQVFQKISNTDRSALVIANDANDDAEQSTDKSSEENSRETDQDEDPFKLSEIVILSPEELISTSNSEDYSFGLLGYYPEIVSPPPQV